MEAFKILIKNSYYDEDGNDVIPTSDATYALQLLIKELADEFSTYTEVSKVIDSLNKLNKLK